MRTDYTRPSHRSLILALLCGLILCWTASAATVQQALSIDRTRDNYPLGRVLLPLEDPQRTLTNEDVAQTANAARFRAALPPNSNVDVNFGYSDSAWWLALPLALDAGAAARWLLEIGYPSLDQVEVYVPRPGGGHEKLVAGDLQRFSVRPYPHRNLVFPLALPPGQAQTVYLPTWSTPGRRAIAQWFAGPLQRPAPRQQEEDRTSYMVMKKSHDECDHDEADVKRKSNYNCTCTIASATGATAGKHVDCVSRSSSS